MSIETEPTAGESIASEASAPARKKTAAAAKPKGAPASKTRKAAGRPPRSSRAKPKGEKLICRYCGSDDVAKNPTGPSALLTSRRTQHRGRPRRARRPLLGGAEDSPRASLDGPLTAFAGVAAFAGIA
jgi:hypothetical protein